METKTITINVDGRNLEVDPDKNLIEACGKAGAKIPTLCFMKDISSNASCGVCVVEVEGAKALVRSCVQKPSPGMKIHTASSRVLSARKTAVELLLANHPTDCLSCIRSGTCELRTLAESLGVRASHYPKLKKFAPPDTSSDGLVRTIRNASSADDASPCAPMSNRSMPSLFREGAPEPALPPSWIEAWETAPACNAANALSFARQPPFRRRINRWK